MPRLHAVTVAALVLGVSLAGCEKQAVRVGFRPPVGATYRYEINVQSVTITTLGDAEPERSVDNVTLESIETVRESGPDAVRVQVLLRRAGSPERTFLVRFDRGGLLAGVDAVDGLPSAVLGPASFPEFLPAAATAPPDRALSPGQKWKIDASPGIGAAADARLKGSGQLRKVTTSGGRKLASIEAKTQLPLASTSRVGDATLALEGTETTESTATRALVDGAVEAANSVTLGTFRLTLRPKAGQPADPVTGTLSVEIRTQTRRLPTDGPGSPKG